MTFLEYLHEHHTSQTADSYSRVIEKLHRHVKEPKSLSYQDIVKYLNNHSTSKQKDLAGIKRYYSYLLETKQIDTHPCINLTIKQPKKAIQFQDLFTKDELELLLNRESRYQLLANRNKVILGLLIYQGLASENIVNLKVSDVDVDNATIRIKATKSFKGRTLQLQGNQIAPMMKYLLKDREELNKRGSNMLFVGMRGDDIQVSSLMVMLRPLKLFFPDRTLNAQSIRQSVIYNWLNKDKLSLEKVQQLTGHRWLSSLEKYKQTDLEIKKQLLNKFHPIR